MVCQELAGEATEVLGSVDTGAMAIARGGRLACIMLVAGVGYIASVLFL